MLKQCDRNFLLPFLCVCMHVLFIYVKKEATETVGQTELGNMGVIVAQSLLEPCLHTFYCNCVLASFLRSLFTTTINL